MILVVGDLIGAARDADAPADGFRFVAFGGVTAALLQEVRPEMVLSSLMGEGFDAIDLARALSRLSFTGPYRALSTPLPDPGAVRDEVRGVAPGIDFDVIIVGNAVH